MYAVQTYIMHQQLRGIYIYCVTEMRLLVLHETSRHLLTKDGWYESRGVFIIEKLQMLTIDCNLQLHFYDASKCNKGSLCQLEFSTFLIFYALKQCIL